MGAGGNQVPVRFGWALGLDSAHIRAWAGNDGLGLSDKLFQRFLRYVCVWFICLCLGLFGRASFKEFHVYSRFFYQTGRTS